MSSLGMGENRMASYAVTTYQPHWEVYDFGVDGRTFRGFAPLEIGPSSWGDRTRWVAEEPQGDASYDAQLLPTGGRSRGGCAAVAEPGG